MLKQWAAGDERPVAWVTLDAGDNDPAQMLGYLVQALAVATPTDGARSDLLAGPLSDVVFFDRVVLPRLARSVRTRVPFLLVLDDVHCLVARDAWRLLAVVLANLPAGSAVVLAGREQVPDDALGLAADGVLRLGLEELAFDPAEAMALLHGLGLAVTAREVAQLLSKTEGWPAALYLAGLSLRGRGDTAAAIAEFSGSSAVVADYLRDEFLQRSSPDLVRLLTRTSILGCLSGPLCDSVAGLRDSAAVLTELSRTNLLVSSVDATGTWYRYHQLFAEMLRAELSRGEPELEPLLHRRASAWFELRGNAEGAIGHALAAGEIRRAADILWREVPRQITTGRRATVERWLETFDPRELAADPLLALASAWCALSTGAPVEPWLVTAELALDREPRTTAQAITPLGAVAMLRAIMAASGAVRMAADAERAVALEPAGSPGAGVASYLAGVAHHLLGRPGTAVGWLERGLELGREHNTPTPWALSAAQLGLLAALDGDWVRGARLVDEATTLVRTYEIDEFATMAPVFASSALVLAHTRRDAEAREAADQAVRLLSRANYLGPWVEVEVRTVLARVHLLLGERDAATSALAEAETRLSHIPDAPVLFDQVEQVRALLRLPNLDGQVGAPALTEAERRVVQLLTTHLSFAEIADRLLVSKNTVKTQAISAYRKLGVNSRSAAVERARALGLTRSPDDPRSGVARS